MSVLNDILDTVVIKIVGLGLNLSGVTIPVVKRKLPKKQENLDPPVQITVCKTEEPEKVTPYVFGNGVAPPRYKVEYGVEVTVVSPNNDDQLTNLPSYAQWREQIRRLFSNLGPFAAVPSVWKTRPEPRVYLDRKLISENYDYQGVVIRATTIEPGS